MKRGFWGVETKDMKVPRAFQLFCISGPVISSVSERRISSPCYLFVEFSMSIGNGAVVFCSLVYDVVFGGSFRVGKTEGRVYGS